MADKNIIGINMGLDPNYVEGIIKETVSATIAEALMGKEEFAKTLINEVLDTKVNRDGKVSKWTNDNDRTTLQYLVSKAVNDAAKEALNECMEDMKPQLKEVIILALKQKKTKDALAEAFLDSVTGAIASCWRSNISFSFDKSE